MAADRGDPRRLGQPVQLRAIPRGVVLVDPPQPGLVELTSEQLEATPRSGRDLLL